MVFSKVHICSCVPRRCVWQTTHFLRQLNCAVEPNGGDYGRCWVSPRSSKKPPRPMVRRREISLKIFSDIFIFASNLKHKKRSKYLGGTGCGQVVLWWRTSVKIFWEKLWADWFLRKCWSKEILCFQCLLQLLTLQPGTLERNHCLLLIHLSSI